MMSEKRAIEESVQQHLEKADWRAAIKAMDKLFSVNPDPIIRVRIGDAHRKLGQIEPAVGEYIRAAWLYFDRGFLDKALAQCKLALRVMPSHADAPWMITLILYAKSACGLNLEPIGIASIPMNECVIMSTTDYWNEQIRAYSQSGSWCKADMQEHDMLHEQGMGAA